MEQLRVQWTEFPTCLTGALGQLQHAGELADVTLACEGRHIHAHKLVLSACSPYFRDAFKENPCHHPIIILKDVQAQDILNLLSYMYHGEVNVEEDNLPSFIQTAELLQIKGLSAGTTLQTKKQNKPLPKSSYQIWKNVTQSPGASKKTTTQHSNSPIASVSKQEGNSQKRRRNSASERTTESFSPDLTKKAKSLKEKRTEPLLTPTGNDIGNVEVQKIDPNHSNSSLTVDNKLPTTDENIIPVKIKHEIEDPPEIKETTNESTNDSENAGGVSPPTLYENSMLARSLLSGVQSLKATDTSATITPASKSKLSNISLSNVTIIRETPSIPSTASNFPVTDENIVKIEALSPKSDIMELEPEVLISEHHVSITAKTSSQLTSRGDQTGASTSQGGVNQNNHAAICGDCPHCGTKYSNQSALKYHVRLMHSDLTNRLCCHLCPRSFTMRDTYKEHMWTSHGQRN